MVLSLGVMVAGILGFCVGYWNGFKLGLLCVCVLVFTFVFCLCFLVLSFGCEYKRYAMRAAKDHKRCACQTLIQKQNKKKIKIKMIDFNGICVGSIEGVMDGWNDSWHLRWNKSWVKNINTWKWGWYLCRIYSWC